jgi:DNA-binding GntR family transcriptional regulator
MPGISHFALSLVPAPAWVAAEFGIAAGSEVRYVERCITADDAPAMVLRDYVPLLVNGAPLQLEGFERFENDFPSAFRALGMRLVKQVANLDARLADAELARLLDVDVGEPLIFAEQFSHAESGETVICTEGYYVSSVYRTVLVRTLSN